MYRNITSKIYPKITWHSKQIMAYQSKGNCEYQSKPGGVGSYTAIKQNLPEGRRLYHMVFGYYLASTFKVLTHFGAGVLCQVF